MDESPAVVATSNIGGKVLAGLAGLAALGLLGGYAVAMRARPKPTKVALSRPAEDRKSERKIFVHVGGAVQRPGLYSLTDGSRIDDAVRAAGGVLEDADLDALNLAARVKDGDKVLVPSRSDTAAASGGPGPPGAAPNTQGGLVNLNTATVADLETLPGIGPALAQRIIDFRERNGGFRTVEDLLEVPGIGAKKFEELREHVTV